MRQTVLSVLVRSKRPFEQRVFVLFASQMRPHYRSGRAGDAYQLFGLGSAELATPDGATETELYMLCRRALLLSTIGLAVCAPTLAQTQNGAVQIRVWCEGPRHVTVPLKRAADGKLYLTAQVSDRNLLMLLDTGASTMLDLGVAKSVGLSLNDAGQSGYGLTGLAGERMTSRFDLRLGALSITGAPVSCLDLIGLKNFNRANNLPEFDGLIGIDLLNLLEAVIDVGKLELKLTRPS